MPFDIDARISEWRKSLLDTTKRNRLIKFVAGRIGGISLVAPKSGDIWTRLVREYGTLTFPWKRDLLGLPREVIDADMLAADYDPLKGSLDPRLGDVARELTEQCRKSPKLRPTHLLTEFTDRQLAARLTRLARTAYEAATDHGVTTLFAAFGFLRWFEDKDSTEELLSPLLLVAISLHRETVESEFTRHHGGGRYPPQSLPRGVTAISVPDPVTDCGGLPAGCRGPKLPAGLSRRDPRAHQARPALGGGRLHRARRLQLPEARDVGGPRPQCRPGEVSPPLPRDRGGSWA